jgi:hypothetical protein
MEQRPLLVALMALLVTLGTNARADAASVSSPAFNRFEHRVCRGYRLMNRKAGPAVLRFGNLIYGEGELTSEDLETAGRELHRAYSIYQRANKRVLAIPAPASSADLWRKYAQQERVVLRLGFRAAAALEAAELPNFNRLKIRNENWQRKRDETWLRLGLIC